MNVEIIPAPVEQKPLFSRLMQLYAYDFSEMSGGDVDEAGLFRHPPLDPYWAEPRWRPFVVRADGACAGFVVLSTQSRLDEGRACGDVAEFFVLRKYRRGGVGTRAATLAFDTFRGPWEVRQITRNTSATAFWRRVIDRYTGGRFREVMRDDAVWRGPVQFFDTSGAPP